VNSETTADKLTAGTLRLMKALARATSPKIRPFTVDSMAGREWFVFFVNSIGFAQLQVDAEIIAANREARPRDVSENPIFQDGDLICNGIIIREIPEIPVVTGVGASSSDVSVGFLVGAQAVAMAWGQEPVSRTKNETDYDFEKGVAIEECRGVAKIIYGGKQYGVVTVWHSAPAAV